MGLLTSLKLNHNAFVSFLLEANPGLCFGAHHLPASVVQDTNVGLPSLRDVLLFFTAV